MTEDKSTLINTCVICGYKTNTRHVKGQGHTCIHCINDDDIVRCDRCGSFHKFSDYPGNTVRRDGLVIRRRICKDCYKPKGENTVSICKKCGRHASLRLVEGRGALCNDCIRDDDLVLCESCIEFKPWSEFPLLERVNGYKLRVCKECKDRGATVRHNPLNGAKYKTRGLGAKKRKYTLKTRRLPKRYDDAIQVEDGTMYIASKKSDAKKLKAKLIKIEAEVEAIERRLLRVKQKRYKFEEILEKQGPIEDRPLEEAYRFIMTRLEDWRKRGHYVTPTSFRNDRGQDLVDLAVEFYGVPRDEVVDKLRREGIEL